MFASGLRYDGDWRDDKAHGSGVAVYVNGDRYDGEWQLDHRWGWGRYDMATGDTYEGTWNDDVIHGKVRCSGAGCERVRSAAVACVLVVGCWDTTKACC